MLPDDVRGEEGEHVFHRGAGPRHVDDDVIPLRCDGPELQVGDAGREQVRVNDAPQFFLDEGGVRVELHDVRLDEFPGAAVSPSRGRFEDVDHAVVEPEGPDHGVRLKHPPFGVQKDLFPVPLREIDAGHPAAVHLHAFPFRAGQEVPVEHHPADGIRRPGAMRSHKEDLLSSRVEPVAVDLALEDLVGKLHAEAAPQGFLDGRRKDADALVVVTFEILPFVKDHADIQAPLAGEPLEAYGGRGSAGAAPDDPDRLPADVLAPG
jgi:hypothetical protein